MNWLTILPELNCQIWLMIKMERTAEKALEILRDIANEVRTKDGSMALHAVANTLEQEIRRLGNEIDFLKGAVKEMMGH